jgi:hypothetical protein
MTLSDSQKTTNFIDPKSAAWISILLCIPFLVIYFSVVYNLEFFRSLLTVDGTRPSTFGYLMIAGGWLSLLAAFVINLLAMVTRPGSEPAPTFRMTRAHWLVGMSVLFIFLVLFSDLVMHELNKLASPLGSGAIFGKILYFAGLLAFPVAFLLNLPGRLIKPRAGRKVGWQPTSINLIVGAAILLVILMVLSPLILETISCGIGIPNCD